MGTTAVLDVRHKEGVAKKIQTRLEKIVLTEPNAQIVNRIISHVQF